MPTLGYKYLDETLPPPVLLILGFGVQVGATNPYPILPMDVRHAPTHNGNILVRKLMNMTLSVDHKVANGAYAAQFLDFVRKLLEDPSSLA